MTSDEGNQFISDIADVTLKSVLVAGCDFSNNQEKPDTDK
jgi:hypothetical protein